jgi:hypothetical protein
MFARIPISIRPELFDPAFKTNYFVGSPLDRLRFRGRNLQIPRGTAAGVFRAV